MYPLMTQNPDYYLEVVSLYFFRGGGSITWISLVEIKAHVCSSISWFPFGIKHIFALLHVSTHFLITYVKMHFDGDFVCRYQDFVDPSSQNLEYWSDAK